MSDIESDFKIKMKPSGKEEPKFPEVVVIIPIMNSPIFPGMIAPIILSEEKFTPELDESLLKTGYIALNLVKNELKDEAGEIIPEEEIDFDKKEIKPGDIYKVGVLCKVVKKLKLPDGSVNILVHGMKRYRARSRNPANAVAGQYCLGRFQRLPHRLYVPGCHPILPWWYKQSCGIRNSCSAG